MFHSCVSLLIWNKNTTRNYRNGTIVTAKNNSKIYTKKRHEMRNAWKIVSTVLFETQILNKKYRLYCFDLARIQQQHMMMSKEATQNINSDSNNNSNTNNNNTNLSQSTPMPSLYTKCCSSYGFYSNIASERDNNICRSLYFRSFASIEKLIYFSLSIKISISI